MSCSKNICDGEITFYCDGCFRNITKCDFISCSICNFDMCVSCFNENIETEFHKKEHLYRIINNLTTDLDSKWSVLDYLIFINGLIICGINNNKGISKLLTTKTEKDIKEKFFELTKFTNNTDNEKKPHNIQRSDPYDPVLINYLPKRQEFEMELFNDYESFIANVEHESSDPLAVKELKDHIFNYLKVINKVRINWKNFVHDRNLLKIDELKVKDQTIYGQFIAKYKWLLQILSKDDFNKILSCLFKEDCYRKCLKTNYDKELSKIQNSSCDHLFSINEIMLCKKLKIKTNSYLKIKRYVLEMFVDKKQIKQTFFLLFPKSERFRAEILYTWFLKNGIVLE